MHGVKRSNTNAFHDNDNDYNKSIPLIVADDINQLIEPIEYTEELFCNLLESKFNKLIETKHFMWLSSYAFKLLINNFEILSMACNYERFLVFTDKIIQTTLNKYNNILFTKYNHNFKWNKNIIDILLKYSSYKPASNFKGLVYINTFQVKKNKKKFIEDENGSYCIHEKVVEWQGSKLEHIIDKEEKQIYFGSYISNNYNNRI